MDAENAASAPRDGVAADYPSRLEALRQRLQADYGAWIGISRETGLAYRTITRFAGGTVRRPHGTFVAALERYYAGRPGREAA